MAISLKTYVLKSSLNLTGVLAALHGFVKICTFGLSGAIKQRALFVMILYWTISRAKLLILALEVYKQK